LQALAYQTQGNILAALTPLSRALTLIEPEGYVRTFVDKGVPMAKLLQEVLARGSPGLFSRTRPAQALADPGDLSYT
jgi:LuxR family maltose regulon positive regulatory protein